MWLQHLDCAPVKNDVIDALGALNDSLQTVIALADESSLLRKHDALQLVRALNDQVVLEIVLECISGHSIL